MGRYIYKYMKSILKRYAPLVRASVKAAKRFVHIARNQGDIFKMHPALVDKLSRTKSLSSAYIFGALYFKSIGQVFNHVEMPLSSRSGGWSVYGLFTGFYDSVLSPDRFDDSKVGYSSKPAQYLLNNMRHNRLAFIKNFIVFVMMNLLFNIANTVVYAAMLLTSPVSVELTAQAITTLSIFFIAVPVGLAGS